MTEKKQEAEAAIDLMTVQYERICREEDKHQGLIIIQARYGRFDDESSLGMAQFLH